MKEELFNFYNKNEPHPIIRSICKRENGVDYVSVIRLQILMFA